MFELRIKVRCMHAHAVLVKKLNSMDTETGSYTAMHDSCMEYLVLS